MFKRVNEYFMGVVIDIELGGCDFWIMNFGVIF